MASTSTAWLRPLKSRVAARLPGSSIQCTHAAAFGTSVVVGKQSTPAFSPRADLVASQRVFFSSEANPQNPQAVQVDPLAVIRERMRQLVPRYKDFGSEVIRRAREQKQAEETSAMYNITVNKLMAAGLHFGSFRQKLRAMNRPLVFGTRHDVHIINLEMTIAYLRRAAHLLRETAMEGGTILFVGTHQNQLSRIVADAARDCNVYYISEQYIPNSLAYPWDHLRRNNPPEYERTVAEDADTKIGYKIYQKEELKYHDWNALLREARAEFRRMKEAQGVDYGKELEETAAKMKEEHAAFDKDVEESGDKAIRMRWRMIRNVESPPITDEEVAWLMERMPEPDRPEDEIAATEFADTYQIKLEDARRLLKEDMVREGRLVEEGILPDHIHYRMRSPKPIDPAADPMYDIEEDLYLTPEQIMEKKRKWIARAERKVVYHIRQLPPHKPDIIVVFNPEDNKRLLFEATECGIPTIGPADTNFDPRMLTYPIPANDDNMRGLALLARVFTHAIQEGHQKAAELKNIGAKIAKDRAARTAAIVHKEEKMVG